MNVTLIWILKCPLKKKEKQTFKNYFVKFFFNSSIINGNYFCFNIIHCVVCKTQTHKTLPFYVIFCSSCYCTIKDVFNSPSSSSSGFHLYSSLFLSLSFSLCSIKIHNFYVVFFHIVIHRQTVSLYHNFSKEDNLGIILFENICYESWIK